MIETKTGVILSSIDTKRVQALCDQDLRRMYIKEREIKFAYPDFAFGLHDGAPHFTMKSHVTGQFFAMRMIEESDAAYVFASVNGTPFQQQWELFIVK